MTLKIYVSPTGRLIREDIGKPAEVALADVFRHTLSTQERTDALAGVYGDEVRIRVLEIEADTPSGTGGAVASVAGKTGIVTLVKADVGLGNVDNTSDANKPISTAQAAVNATVAATVATKADKLTTVSVTTAGNFDLTEAAHNGRRIVAAVPGVVFTKTTAWGASSIGCFLDVDADGTFSLGTGITVPSGCAAGSATAAGGAIDLACVDGVLSSKTAALAVGGNSNIRVFQIAAAADLNANSAVDAQVLSVFVPSVSATARFALNLAIGGTGSGTRDWALRIATSNSSGAIISMAAGVDTQVDLLMQFIQTAQAAQVGSRGASGALAYGASGAAAGRYAAAVDSSSGIYLNLWLKKATAADVASILGGQLVVTQP